MKSRLLLASILVTASLAAMLVLFRREASHAREVERASPLASLDTSAPQAELADESNGVLRSPTGERAVAVQPPAVVNDASSSTPADAPLHPIVLHGHVRFDDGSAIGGEAAVILHHEDGESRHVLVVEGHYEVAGLLPGNWRVRCFHDDYRTVGEVVTLSKRERERRLDFVLSRVLAIPVRFVTPSGAVLVDELQQAEKRFGWSIYAVSTREPPPERFDTTSSVPVGDGTGTYRPRHAAVHVSETAEPDGHLEIHGALPLFVSATFRGNVLATQVLAAPVEELVFTIEPLAVDALAAGFVVRILDEQSGGPPPRVGAFLFDGNGMWNLPEPNEHGVLRCKDLQPGRYRLMVNAPGRAGLMLDVSLPPGIETDLGSHVLTVGTQLSGRLVTGEDAPIQCWMRIHRVQDSSPLDETMFRAGQVEDDGEFKATLTPGQWLVEFGGGDPSDDAPTVLELPPGGSRLGALRAYDTTHGPFEGEVVRLEPTTTVRLVPRADLGAQTSFKLLEAEGTVALRNGWLDLLPETVRVVPGAYRLQIRDALGKQIREDEVVVGTDPIELEIGR